MAMLIGYARVSTTDQDPRLQIDALELAGCTRIFVDEGVSGAAVIKPELAKALTRAQSNHDTLVVWKLDRLGRSTRDLIDTVAMLRDRGIGLRSLKEEAIDTTTPTGNLVFQIFSVIAEYERNANLERTMAGIAAARKVGVRMGRPPSVSEAKWQQARELFHLKPTPPVSAIAKLLGVSRQTVQRRLDQDKQVSVSRPDDDSGTPGASNPPFSETADEITLSSGVT